MNKFFDIKKTTSPVNDRERMVRLVCNITRDQAAPLDWIDPYSEKKIPIAFPEMIDENGNVFYEVPMPYAKRLLADSKFSLVEPGEIVIWRDLQGGSREAVTIKAKTPHIDPRGQWMRNEHGVPQWIHNEKYTPDANPEPVKA